jgi:hypothetical protein
MSEVETQKLACALTPEDRERKSADLVRLELEESAKKAEKKALVAGVNSELKLLRADIDKLAKELHEGEEVREVEVEAVFDYEAKRVEYKRRDTGVVIDSREMDAFDLQESLPSEDLLPPPSKPQKRTRKKRGELTDVPDAS